MNRSQQIIEVLEAAMSIGRGFGMAGNFPVSKNPRNRSELFRDILVPGPDEPGGRRLRFAYDIDAGDLYVWHSQEAVHVSVTKEIGNHRRDRGIIDLDRREVQWWGEDGRGGYTTPAEEERMLGRMRKLLPGFHRVNGKSL